MTTGVKNTLLFFILLVLILPSVSMASIDDSTQHTSAPLYDYRFSPAVDYSSLHILRPIVKYESKADEYDVALRPLFYHSAATERDASLTDVLFPVFQSIGLMYLSP